MAWFYLVMAGIFEVGWAIGLKYTEGFSRLWPSLWTVLAMGLSLWCLAMSLKTVAVGTGYAVWTGIGAIGTALLGMWLFDESHDPARVGSLLLIVGGIIGLKLSSGN
jgi:quaternary ammonium compound-resistance protein SugE